MIRQHLWVGRRIAGELDVEFLELGNGRVVELSDVREESYSYPPVLRPYLESEKHMLEFRATKLVLDLEGTLISNAVSQIARPQLKRFDPVDENDDELIRVLKIIEMRVHG